MRATASGICKCEKCEARTTSIYRMVGWCQNCYADVLMLFRVGDSASPLTCPICGVFYSVKAKRLATDDEIPAAFETVPA